MTAAGASVLDVRTCDGCGMSRLARRYKRRWWLCVNGPNKCYRHRRRVAKMLEALNGRKGK